MNQTKHLYLFLYYDCIDLIYIELCIYFHCYQEAKKYQTKYIRKVENYNNQNLLGKAYYRMAKLYFHEDMLIQTIDNCLMAIYTYSYDKRDVFMLCAKAYRILTLNCRDFEDKSLWIQQILNEKELLK